MAIKAIQKLMAVADLVCGFLLLFGLSSPQTALRVFSFYLVGKGGFFTLSAKDIPSFIDLLAGLYGVGIFFFHLYNPWISLVFFIFLAQKALIGLAL